MNIPPFERILIEGADYRPRTQESARGVLLTATISPPRASVARADPTERIRDYQAALAFYLKLPSAFVHRILFVDNSASDLRPLIDVVESTPHDKAVELISFAGNDHPQSYGKVYGEFKLLDFGLARTSLFSEADYIWKVTGRLRLVNIVEMIEAAPRGYELLCDLHNVPLVGSRKVWKNTYMELRTFSCTLRGYDRLFRGEFDELGPRFGAGYLYDLVIRERSTAKIVPRFPLQPQFAGHSGRHNRAYDSGTQAMKTRLRSVLRRVAPWLWI